MHNFCGAWVICEPWFTGSRDLCELWKYVYQNSKYTEKSCESGSQKFGSQKFGSQNSGSQKFGSRTIFKFFYSNSREPNFCVTNFL